MHLQYLHGLIFIDMVQYGILHQSIMRTKWKKVEGRLIMILLFYSNKWKNHVSRQFMYLFKSIAKMSIWIVPPFPIFQETEE